MTRAEQVGLNYILGRFEGIALGLEFARMDRARDALLETCTMLEEWISASEVESWSEEQDG